MLLTKEWLCEFHRGFSHNDMFDQRLPQAHSIKATQNYTHPATVYSALYWHGSYYQSCSQRLLFIEKYNVIIYISVYLGYTHSLTQYSIVSLQYSIIQKEMPLFKWFNCCKLIISYPHLSKSELQTEKKYLEYSFLNYW